MNTSRRQAGKALTAIALAASGLGASTLALAQGSGPIKVGILHSLSGTAQTVPLQQAAEVEGARLPAPLAPALVAARAVEAGAPAVRLAALLAAVDGLVEAHCWAPWVGATAARIAPSEAWA